MRLLLEERRRRGTAAAQRAPKRLLVAGDEAQPAGSGQERKVAEETGGLASMVAPARGAGRPAGKTAGQ